MSDLEGTSVPSLGGRELVQDPPKKVLLRDTAGGPICFGSHLSSCLARVSLSAVAMVRGESAVKCGLGDL